MRSIVVLSGGQDSTLCLFLAKARGDEIHAVTFDYGQRHWCEIDAARRVARMADVASHEVIDLDSGVSQVLIGSSPLVSATQLEQYANYSVLPGGVEKTFVPGRNALFLIIAANRAAALGADRVITGVSQEDYGGYPDCRGPFLAALQNAIELGFGFPIRIETPLLNKTKADTVRMAVTTPGAYVATGYSHTSYDGQYPPIGKDHATLLRAKGFDEAGIPDPLVVRAYWEGKMALPSSPAYEGRWCGVIDAFKPRPGEVQSALSRLAQEATEL